MKPSLKTLVGDFIGEWAESQARLNDAIKRKDLGSFEFDILPGPIDQPRSISRAGSRLLEESADALLKQTRMQLKLSRKAGRVALVDALFAQLPKAKKTGQMSEDAVIKRAVERLRAWPRDDGLYVFPISFAPLAKRTSFWVGPLRIVSKTVFLRENRAALRRLAEGVRSKATSDWRRHLRAYDHVVVVDITGFEREMAWEAGRDAVEFLLNLIRMLFPFWQTSRIRVGGGFVWETLRSALVLGSDGVSHLTTAYGPWGTHLEDSWTDEFDQNFWRFQTLLGSFAYWLIDGEHADDPTFERLRYANRLLAEAYCEPNDQIRLVRMVSALEALSLLDGADKAHQLARRCACVAGSGDPARAIEVYDAVREAYRWRSAVVHGDAPSVDDVRASFLALEGQLLEIYLGYLVFFAALNRGGRIQSVNALRRAFKAKIDLFYWDSDLID